MINVHASLLPRFRGAAPIQHAILAGDRETGISIMQMEEGLDSGPVLHRVATPIGRRRDRRRADRRGSPSSARRALVEALSLMSAGRRVPQPQDAAARDLRAQDLAATMARIDWIARRRVAGAADPGVRSGARRLDPARRSAGQALRRAARGRQVGRAGHSCSRPPTGWSSRAATGAVAVREVQPAGRNRLTAEEWVRGRGIAAGSRFE